MSVARHPRPKELEGVPVEEIMKKYVGRFREKKPDWAAFEDAKIEGLQARAASLHRRRRLRQARRSDRDPGRQLHALDHVCASPARATPRTPTRSRKCFFVLQGYLDVFVEDESGKRITTRLGPWECIACPAGVIHGYQNDCLEPVYFQVMLGRGKPEAMGYADDELVQAPRRAPEGGVGASSGETASRYAGDW